MEVARGGNANEGCRSARGGGSGGRGGGFEEGESGGSGGGSHCVKKYDPKREREW